MARKNDLLDVVYDATFADGFRVRMSFATPASHYQRNGRIDFEAGRRTVNSVRNPVTVHVFGRRSPEMWSPEAAEANADAFRWGFRSALVAYRHAIQTRGPLRRETVDARRAAYRALRKFAYVRRLVTRSPLIAGRIDIKRNGMVVETIPDPMDRPAGHRVRPKIPPKKALQLLLAAIDGKADLQEALAVARQAA